MAARSAWKGYLKLSLISMPVKAFTAKASDQGGIRLNQLHSVCNSRIKYQKTCPVHGVVPKEEIVSGYEHAKDAYVVVDTDELEKLRSEDDKAITIKEFIHEGDLDPIYLTERTYFLVPDGNVGERAFAVLQKGMAEQHRYGIAQVVLHGKEQVVLLRPVDGLLAMTPLSHYAEIASPTSLQDELPKVDTAPEEVKLIKTLIDASTEKKFDFSKYHDVYTEKLTKLIEAKVNGQELVVSPAHEENQVINLMEALKQSVAKLQKTGTDDVRPVKKMAPSKTKPEAKKKKTS